MQADLCLEWSHAAKCGVVTGADPGFHVRGGGAHYMKHKVHEGSCDGRRRKALLRGPGACSPKYYFYKMMKFGAF